MGFCIAISVFSGLFLLCLSLSCVPYVTSFSGLFLHCLSLSCVPHENNPEKLESWGSQDEDKQNKSNPEKMVT
jgi:hypothetical protein